MNSKIRSNFLSISRKTSFSHYNPKCESCLCSSDTTMNDSLQNSGVLSGSLFGNST